MLKINNSVKVCARECIAVSISITCSSESLLEGMAKLEQMQTQCASHRRTGKIWMINDTTIVAFDRNLLVISSHGHASVAQSKTFYK